MTNHSYKIGDKVVVWNQSVSGRTFCEGRGTVRKILDRDDAYMVEFDIEPGATYERVVELDAADLPDDDARVQPAPQPSASMGSAVSREIPAA